MINIRQKNVAIDAVLSYTTQLEATGRPEPSLPMELRATFEAVYGLGFDDVYSQLERWANNNYTDQEDRTALRRVLELLRVFGLQD